MPPPVLLQIVDSSVWMAVHCDVAGPATLENMLCTRTGHWLSATSLSVLKLATWDPPSLHPAPCPKPASRPFRMNNWGQVFIQQGVAFRRSRDGGGLLVFSHTHSPPTPSKPLLQWLKESQWDVRVRRTVGLCSGPGLR